MPAAATTTTPENQSFSTALFSGSYMKLPATVDWSDSLNGTARSQGSTVTLPTALVVPNTSLIWAEVQYSYKPAIGYVVSGTLTLKDQIYMRPRLSDQVTRTSS